MVFLLFKKEMCSNVHVCERLGGATLSFLGISCLFEIAYAKLIPHFVQIMFSKITLWGGRVGMLWLERVWEEKSYGHEHIYF